MDEELPVKLFIEGGVQMDITEKYTLINKKADQVQKLLHPGVRAYGTPFWYENVVIRVFAGEAFYFTGFDESRKETVWLPTQDQLQRIVKSSTPEYLVGDFFNFIWDEKLGKKKEIVSEMDTMEQLWLAYIVYTKYKKVWNNKQKEWLDSKQ
jgi:hypothetical protein